MPVKQETISDRLLMIETFVNMPPETDFQRGYLFALMEEAVEDMADAASNIFAKALELYKDDEVMYRSWSVRRARTIG